MASRVSQIMHWQQYYTKFLFVLCLDLFFAFSYGESSWKQLYYESSSSSFEEDDIFLIFCSNNEEEVSILKSIEEAIVSDDDEANSTPEPPPPADKQTRKTVTKRQSKHSLPVSKEKEKRLTFVQALDLVNLPLVEWSPSKLQLFLLPRDEIARAKPLSRVGRLRVPGSKPIFNEQPIVSVDNSPALDRIILSQWSMSANNLTKKKSKQLIWAEQKPTKQSLRKEHSTIWIHQFLEFHPDHGLFVVPRDFLMDNFNLANLPETLGISSECFRSAWKTLLHEPYHESHEVVRNLFFLIHQRFILSPRGLHLASRRKSFGRCPSPDCGSHTVPIGHSNLPGKGVAFEYCGKCQKQWINWSWQNDPIVDGCAWGTTFAHLLRLVYGLPKTLSEDCRHSKEPPYVPRIYGFKLHWSASHS